MKRRYSFLLWTVVGCVSKLKRSLRSHDGSTNINIFILLSSLTAPGRPNHAYSINKRHAQRSQVSVWIHTHPQIPWQKRFVFTRACKRDRREKKHRDKDRGRRERERCKKSLRTNPRPKKNALFATGHSLWLSFFTVHLGKTNILT